MKLSRLRQKNKEEMLEMVQLEDTIKNLISTVQRKKKSIECFHLTSFYKQHLSHSLIRYDSSVNYHDQFWRTYLRNESWIQRIHQMSRYILELRLQLQQIKNLFVRHDKLAVKLGLKGKKSNRIEDEQSDQLILKQRQTQILCHIPQCQKSFSSHSALNLHYRISHTDQRLFDSSNIHSKLVYCVPSEDQKFKNQFNQPIVQQEMVEINSCHFNDLVQKQDSYFIENPCISKVQYSNNQIKKFDSSFEQQKNQPRLEIIGENYIRHSPRIEKLQKKKDNKIMPVQTRQSKCKKKFSYSERQQKTKKIRKETQKRSPYQDESFSSSIQQSIGSLEDIIQLDSSNQLL